MSEKKPPDAELPDEPEPTAEELKGAASLAKLIDRLTEGRPPPPAMRAEDRMLLDAATMIHASHRAQPIEPRKVNELVGEVLADPKQGPHSLSRMIAFPPKGTRKARGAAADGAAPVEPLDQDIRPRTRLRFFVGGAVLAAAACIAIFFMALGGSGRRGSLVASTRELPAMLRSRPSAALLGGPIAKSEAGDARERIDLVYADRLQGYRELSYRQAAARPRKDVR